VQSVKKKGKVETFPLKKKEKANGDGVRNVTSAKGTLERLNGCHPGSGQAIGKDKSGMPDCAETEDAILIKKKTKKHPFRGRGEKDDPTMADVEEIRSTTGVVR